MFRTLQASEKPIFGVKNLTNDHLWVDLKNVTRPLDQAPPALFLDRDGVIVRDAHYIGDPDLVELLAGAGQFIHAANDAAIPVIVVSNQSGIGRGYFDWPDFEAVQNRIESLLAEFDAKMDAVLACPHHQDALPPYQHTNHPCRKPNPGMLLTAKKILNINLARSWIVGDKAGDLKAGKLAGLCGGVHVATHPDVAIEESEKAKKLESDKFRVETQIDMTGIWDTLSF